MDIIARAEDLVKRYKNITALDHFGFKMKNGEILGLLGPNGCGKTTAILCLLSLLKAERGEVYLFGKKMSPEQYEIKRRIGVVPQQISVFDELNVSENIDYFCGLYVKDKIKRKKLVADAIEFAGLEKYARTRPKKLSGGYLRRLNIACGIAHKPDLIIMDEPTVAVDVGSRNHILNGIEYLNEAGASVIYTTHYMEEAERLCSNIIIMDGGKAAASGSVEQLKKSVRGGEKITVKTDSVPKDVIEKIKGLKGVYSVSASDAKLTVKCENGASNVVDVIEYLKQSGTSYGDISIDQCSLNDVFLEITGKHLNDARALKESGNL